jgi:hypothetical protein
MLGNGGLVPLILNLGIDGDEWLIVTIPFSPCEEDGSGVKESEFYSTLWCLRELRILGVAKARIVRQRSNYSGLERGIEDLKARSRRMNMEPVGHSPVERRNSVFVLLLSILAKK